MSVFWYRRKGFWLLVFEQLDLFKVQVDMNHRSSFDRGFRELVPERFALLYPFRTVSSILVLAYVGHGSHAPLLMCLKILGPCVSRSVTRILRVNVI